MKFVWLLLNKDGHVVALYDDVHLATQMKKPVEEKLKLELTLEKRSVNQDIKRVGEEK